MAKKELEFSRLAVCGEAFHFFAGRGGFAGTSPWPDTGPQRHGHSVTDRDPDPWKFPAGAPQPVAPSSLRVPTLRWYAAPFDASNTPKREVGQPAGPSLECAYSNHSGRILQAWWAFRRFPALPVKDKARPACQETHTPREKNSRFYRFFYEESGKYLTKRADFHNFIRKGFYFMTGFIGRIPVTNKGYRENHRIYLS